MNNDINSMYPVQMETVWVGPKKTWQDTLTTLYERWSHGKRVLIDADNRNKWNLQVVTRMQGLFPGEYTIEEYYNPNKGRFDARLVFEDPRKEMLWKIQHG